MADLNRIKTVLAERGIMSKWLAKTLAQIAEVLNVDIYELICHTKVE